MHQTTDENNRDVENGYIEPPAATTKQKSKEYEATNKGKSMSFEEAIALTKFGKFNYFIIFISGIILNAVLMETLGISFVLPVSECDLRLTTQNKGVLSAIGFLGIITSSHLWGFLADTTGRKRVIKPTLLMAFCCSVLSSLTNNFYVFAFLRFFSGFFVSGSSATVYAYLSEFHSNQQRGRAIMGAALIFGVFCILLPVIAWLVINQEWAFYIPIIDVMFRPWKLYLVVCSLPSLLSYLALIILPESPKFVLSHGKQQEAIDILEKINRWNNGGKSAKPLNIGEIHEEIEAIENRKKLLQYKGSRFYILKSMWSQTAPLFMPPYLSTTMLACTIQFGIYATSNGMYMWFPDILNRMASNLIDNPDKRISMCAVISSSLQNKTVAEMPSKIYNSSTEMHCVTKLEMSTYEHSIVLELLYVAGFAFIGAIINSVRKLMIIFVTLAGCGAAGIVTILVDIPILAIYLYVVLLMCGLAVTVVNASTVELYPTNLRAMAMCISLMMGRMGSVVGAYVCSFLDYHCEAVFLSSGISLILCSVLAFLIPNIAKPSKKSLEPRHSISSRIQ